jgi:Ca2+-binding EF-hand superfamily protein
LGSDFATLDADGDGSITEADLAARMAARFAQADADGSGGLTAAEMVAMAEIIRQEQMAARMAARVAQIDDSADGEIQLEELQARAPAAVHFFDNFDTDNDGAISPDEYAAAQDQMAAAGVSGTGVAMSTGCGIAEP